MTMMARLVIEGESVTVTVEDVAATEPRTEGISSQDIRVAADAMAMR